MAAEERNRFKGKWAIILGGSSGLGLASAKKLASHGMDICIVHRDRRSFLPDFEREMEILKKHGVKVKNFNANALSDEVREKIVAQFAPESVGLLLHSIAKGSLKKMEGDKGSTLTKEDLDITLHAMATSWYEWTKSLYVDGKFSSKARNIAFTSEGNSRVWPGYAAVSTAKSALESLMRYMAAEWAPFGINSNCIQAGTTPTASFLAIPQSERLSQLALERNPMNRLTTPQDVGNAVYLLCLPEADWINGTVLKVDGGESLR